MTLSEFATSLLSEAKHRKDCASHHPLSENEVVRLATLKDAPPKAPLYFACTCDREERIAATIAQSYRGIAKLAFKETWGTEQAWIELITRVTEVSLKTQRETIL